MPTGILKIKLGRPYQMPSRRLGVILAQVRRDCCRARNAAMMHWYAWRRDHPDWKPGDPYEAPPAKIKRKSKASAEVPKDPPVGPRLFMSRELYDAAGKAAPRLNGSVLSACVQDAIKRLKTRVPYDHDGESRYVWEAILANEVSLPTWRGGVIAALHKCTVVGYDGRQTMPERNVEQACNSGAVLKLPLLSRRSGYRIVSPLVRLHVGDLSKGHKRLIRSLVVGDLTFRDSSVAERDGKWYFLLCYGTEANGSGLPDDRVLTVVAGGPDSRRPFEAAWPEGHWGIGSGLPLVAEYRRVQARRRALRYRYRDGMGSGHGRVRFYRTIKPLSRAVVDMQARFTKQTVADVLKLALRERCGMVLYREPTKPARTKSWFAARDVPYNWVEFESRLRAKCEEAGIAIEVERMRMAEFREVHGMNGDGEAVS